MGVGRVFDGLTRPPGKSWCDVLANLPQTWMTNLLSKLDEATCSTLANRPWWFMARPEQEVPAGAWSVWLILTGRGWGKTRTGAETILDWVIETPEIDGAPSEWAVIGESIRDAREILVNGPSGLVRALERRGFIEGTDWAYHSTFGILTLTEHGQKIHVLGADDADVGRGLNLAGAWLDEMCKWRYSYEAWTEGIAPALRMGRNPRTIVTTTPKPIKVLRDWVSRTDGSVFLTRGSTFDNRANLSKIALAELKRRYEGTRTGRQELDGELLDDVEGALWTRSQIDADRVKRHPTIIRAVVAVDPAVTSGEDADETGIIVAGLGDDGRGYVLADRTLRTTPLLWATAVVQAYDDFDANEVVIETNQGGEALVTVLHTVRPNLPVTMVTAKKGKRVRAEPISSLYEQHKVSHVGPLHTLEDQLCTWTPEDTESPDRMDALVYAIQHLMLAGDAESFLSALAKGAA